MSPAEQDLERLLAEAWDWTMAQFPEWATRVGHPGHDHRWTDLSAGAIAERKRRARRSLQALQAIPRDGLGPEAFLNHELYRRRLELEIEGQRFPEELLPVNQMWGIQAAVPETLMIMRRSGRQEAEAILARIRSAADLLDQAIALMQEGVRRGITPPAITLRDVPDQVRRIVADDGPLARLVEELADGLEPGPAADLRRQGRAALEQALRPAYARLLRYLEQDYLPAARHSVGLADLPEGEAWYAHAVRQYTTTDLTPRRIHEIGQAEVARIRAEMGEVMAETGFAGPFQSFLEFLRRDPRFFFDTPEALLCAYRDIAKRADAELVRLFGALPRLPYGVQPVPAYAEKSQTTAYYQPGSAEAARPGVFYANTYDLKSRPRWEMEALSLHEAVPGHHLQIALAQERADLPAFRRHDYLVAYVEGWGLYAESLGAEMGFYRDPYSRFGRLTYEMWRAIRLVVDTGLHALGWSRDQAIAYFEEHAGKAGHDIVVEVDRYIVWPGQALAYKIGEMKIQELRRHAARRLGERFDIRAFHDRILVDGPLPMDLLDDRLRRWVAERAAGGLE